MKNAWNKNVLISSARMNAIKISPGSSPRKRSTGLRWRAASGSGASSDSRSAVVFTPQAYRLGHDGARFATAVPPLRPRFEIRSRELHRHLERLERGPCLNAPTQTEAGGRAQRDLGDDRRRRVEADPRALSLDRDRRDASPKEVPRRAEGRWLKVERDIGRAENADHVGARRDLSRPRHDDLTVGGD